jgi:putative ABC transport system ATP-binding protein
MSDDHQRWRPPSQQGTRRSPFVTATDQPASAREAVVRRQPERLSDILTPLVDVQGVTRDYPIGDHVVHALRGVDLRVQRGHLIAVKGRSGSGKTTLLNIVGGLDKPTAGSVLIDGVDVVGMSEGELINLRRHKIGFIFQAFGLVPILSAAENVGIPLRLANANVAQREERVRILLELVGLAERANHRPAELSGGEQQRVAIARALANQPEILLADEPTGQLDSQTGRSIMVLIRALVRSEGVTAIVATHDPILIDLADRVIELSDGQIIGELVADVEHYRVQR